jgi:hypothetical protein
MPSLPTYHEYGVRLNRETAGTGGIRSITGRRLKDGSLSIEIVGELLPPIPRNQAPNYNRKWLPGSDATVGLPNYDIAHLWGPGFGDEAWDGMMFAPIEVNQKWQSRGIEQRLRDMQAVTRPRGTRIELTARAVSYPVNAWRGQLLLREASYVFGEGRPGAKAEWLGRVEILIGRPVAPSVEFDVSGVFV